MPRESVSAKANLWPVGLCPIRYFILWLREYTAKYNEWAQYSKSQRNDVDEYRPDWPLQSSSQLAMFYSRAKQTFFTPNSNYELDLPSDILTPFHASNSSPHPDPAVFAEVACETQKMLRESLKRFVIAAYNNVGNNRVLCGMIAGVTLCLVGSLPLITYNFVHGSSRWSRLAAFPGMWVGLTILFSALNGVCLAVYLMGDVRQLRKFELARPPISKPQLLNTLRQRPVISFPISGPITPIVPITQPPRLSIVPPPPAHVHVTQSLSHVSISSFSSSIVSSSGSSADMGVEDAIHISPAYFDEEQVEGPAISPATPDATFTFPKRSYDESGSLANSFANTASFIHPFNPLVNNDYDSYNGPKPRPEDHQPISAFDFDALPPRMFTTPASSMPALMPLQPQHDIFIEPEVENHPKTKRSARTFIERLQSKCNVNKWQVVVGGTPNNDINSSPTDLYTPQQPRRRVQKSEAMVRAQFKLVKAVPAFASPLTRILSPIVVRGQWEIVIRSAFIALLVSWIILGSLLAVPVVKWLVGYLADSCPIANPTRHSFDLKLSSIYFILHLATISECKVGGSCLPHLSTTDLSGNPSYTPKSLPLKIVEARASPSALDILFPIYLRCTNFFCDLRLFPRARSDLTCYCFSAASLYVLLHCYVTTISWSHTVIFLAAISGLKREEWKHITFKRLPEHVPLMRHEVKDKSFQGWHGDVWHTVKLLSGRLNESPKMKHCYCTCYSLH